MSHFVYIIECSNGHYYTGYTTDLSRRYKEHERGTTKCRYTRSFPPKKLLAHWQLSDKSCALSYERKIKKLSREDKEKLITNFKKSPEKALTPMLNNLLKST